MNYKSILFALLSTVLIFTSCNKSSDLSNAIPADAKYVMYFDTKSLIDKSEYDVFQNETVQRTINMSKTFMKNKDQIKLIDDFLKDANSLGLNLKDEFYMYTDYKVYGIILGVNDSEKVKEVMIKSSALKEDNVTEENGVFTVSPKSGACVVWNNNKIILLIDISKAYSYSGEVNVIELAKAQLTQSSDKSINSNKAYQDFWKEKKDFSAFYTMKGLDQLPEMTGMMSTLLLGVGGTSHFQEYFKEVEGLSAGVYVSFEKGEIQYTSKLFYESPEVEKRIKELANDVTGTLKGDHFKYITADPLFIASVNVKGKGVEGYLKSLGLLDYMTNNLDSTSTIAFSTVVKSLNGDVTFALTSMRKLALLDDYYEKGGLSQVPECVLFADIDNSQEMIDMITTALKKDQVEYTEISPSVFVLSPWENVKVYFGVENNMFFATNIESVYTSLNSSDLKNNYADKIKGKSAIVFGDVQKLNQFLSQSVTDLNFPSNDVKTLMMVTNLLTKYEMSVSSADLTSEGKLQFVDKDNNSLKTICKFIDAKINESASSFLR